MEKQNQRKKRKENQRQAHLELLLEAGKELLQRHGQLALDHLGLGLCRVAMARVRAAAATTPSKHVGEFLVVFAGASKGEHRGPAAPSHPTHGHPSHGHPTHPSPHPSHPPSTAHAKHAAQAAHAAKHLGEDALSVTAPRETRIIRMRR